VCACVVASQPAACSARRLTELGPVPDSAHLALIPVQDFERQAAAKRRAMQILELQREDQEWRAQVKETAAANAQDVLRTTLTQVGGLYAMSQACLLSVFVPQKCPAVTACLPDGSPPPGMDTCISSPWFNYPVDVPDGHLCSLKENLDWQNCTVKNRNVIIINAVTLVLMLIAQAYFWKRETWMINNLEEDNAVPYDSLPGEIEKAGDTDVAEAVYSYNLGAFIMASLVMTFVVINFGVSADFLIEGDGVYNYSLGTRTIVGLLTNTMLVSTKVIGYLTYSRLSYANAWAISMFTVVPLSYNRLDDTRINRTKTIADVPINFEDLDLEEATSQKR
jgi:hypothetical protein